MNVRINRSRISGKLRAPPSKSHAIRLVIASLLTDVHLSNLPKSDDLLVSVNIVRELGVKISNGKFSRKKSTPDIKKQLWFGGSGTTLRMMLPILAFLGGEFKLDGEQALRNRPLKEEIIALSEAGLEFSSHKLPLTMKGSYETDRFRISGWESSQSISGLIYGLLLLGGGKIDIIPPITSRHYIELTCSLLRSLGAKIFFEENTITVEESTLQKYSGKVPGDYLLSSFYAASAYATGGSITITDLPEPDKWWGDHSIISILSNSNIESSFSNGTWKVSSEKAGDRIESNIYESPDMAVTIASFAPFLKGRTRMDGIENLRTKESDRILSIMSVMQKFGVKSRSGKFLSISGRPPVRDATIDTMNDHRIAMLSTVLSLYSGGTIINAECVNKSNGEFFSDMIELGGDLRLIREQ